MVRWGMVGCGAVTEKKSAPAYYQVPGSELTAVAARRPSAAKAYAARHGIVSVFDDPDDLIRSPHVDAVYIATPPSSHFALALGVAEELDLFDFFAGPISEVSGVSRNQQGLYQVPDAVAASWCHVGGATGSAFWNFGALHQADEVEVIGANGRIRFSVFDEAPLLLQTMSEVQKLEIPNPDPIQRHHVEHMLRHLSGDGQHPSIGESAASTEWVMDLILRECRG